jgi:hypothetical protein
MRVLNTQFILQFPHLSLRLFGSELNLQIWRENNKIYVFYEFDIIYAYISLLILVVKVEGAAYD